MAATGTDISRSDPQRNDRFRMTASLPGHEPVSVDLDLKDLLSFNQAQTEAGAPGDIHPDERERDNWSVTISRLPSASADASDTTSSAGPARSFGLSRDQSTVLSGLLRSHKRQEEDNSYGKTERLLLRAWAVASIAGIWVCVYRVLSHEGHLQSLLADNKDLREQLSPHGEQVSGVTVMTSPVANGDEDEDTVTITIDRRD